MKILISNGLIVNPPEVTEADVLIDGDTIEAVEKDLAPGDAEVIDATGRLVVPGFVDTHRHTWQTALQGAAADGTLTDYLERILGTFGPRYSPDDVYAGNLAGALDALDAGITTLLDWSHIQNSPAHGDAAVRGLRDSGIRAVFAHGTGLPLSTAPHPEDARRIRAELLPHNEGLVTMALAVSGPQFGPIDIAEADIRLARELGLPISMHVFSDAPVQAMHERGLLGPDITYVHGNALGDEGLKLIAGSGGSVSVSPLTETLMGMGTPATVRLRAHGITASLSADSVTGSPGDMFAQVRGALAFARMEDPSITAADVLHLATAGGAATLGMAGRIGAIRPGMQADIVLLNGAAPLDPIGAIAAGADRSWVETVLVAGQVVKRAGRLVHHDVRRVRDLLGDSLNRLA